MSASEDRLLDRGRHPDPTRVATEFFAALEVGDWDGAVRQVEPRSLAEFREAQLALFTSWAAQRDEFRRARSHRESYLSVSDSTFDAEVLERHGDVRLHALAGAPTLAEVAALPAETFAARLLAAGRAAPSAYRVFGHVLEDDDVAHIVYHPIHEGTRSESLDVAVLHARRHDGRWYVLLSHDLADAAFVLFHLDDPPEADEEADPA